MIRTQLGTQGHNSGQLKTTSKIEGSATLELKVESAAVAHMGDTRQYFTALEHSTAKKARATATTNEGSVSKERKKGGRS